MRIYIADGRSVDGEGIAVRLRNLEEPIAVVSTHLDDAVLSCAHLLNANPGATVITVFAGSPDEMHNGYNSHTTGMGYAPDTLRVRRSEDALAMAVLSSNYVWLDLLEYDYVRTKSRVLDHPAIVKAVLGAVTEIGAKTVVAPLGLVHTDHVSVGNACVEIASNSDQDWHLYMDLPYGLNRSRKVAKRLAEVERWIDLDSPRELSGDPHVKRRAMKMYASQYGPTKRNFRKRFQSAMTGPEVYWDVLKTHPSSS